MTSLVPDNTRLNHELAFSTTICISNRPRIILKPKEMEPVLYLNNLCLARDTVT